MNGKKGSQPDQKRILIVDDETSIALTLGMILEQNGYQVITANRGDVVLPIVKDQSFDLIILDILMPGLNGLELIPLIRDCCPDTPIAMHAASIKEDQQNMAIELGAMEFWRKPMDPREILERIKKILG